MPRAGADGHPGPRRSDEPAGAGLGDSDGLADLDGRSGDGPDARPTPKSLTLVQAQDSASSYLRAAYKASPGYAALRQRLARAAAAVGFTPEGTPAPRGSLFTAAELEPNGATLDDEARITAGAPQTFQCAGVCGAGDRDEAQWATSFGKQMRVCIKVIGRPP